VKLSERLEALLALAECTDDAERDHNAPDAECVFVDVRPAVFDALLREAAAIVRAVEGAAQADVHRHAHMGPIALVETESLVGKRVLLVPLDAADDGRGG